MSNDPADTKHETVQPPAPESPAESSDAVEASEASAPPPTPTTAGHASEGHASEGQASNAAASEGKDDASNDTPPSDAPASDAPVAEAARQSEQPAAAPVEPAADSADASPAAGADDTAAPAPTSESPAAPAADSGASDASEASAAVVSDPASAPGVAPPTDATDSDASDSDAPESVSPPGAADAAAEAAGTPDAPAPQRDFQIGSRRGDKKQRPQGSRPQTPGSKPGAPPRPTGPVPVPSKRGPLTDDLEQEMEAALGGLSTDDLLASQGATEAPSLEADARVPAEVVRIHGDNVFLSLGGRNEGVASLRSFAENAQPEIGQKMEVVVSGVSRDDGLYEVRVPGASIDVSDWSDLVEGAVVEARITGTNTGGLECKINNIRGFIPASQIALYRIEDFSDYTDKKLTCVVTEVNQKKKNLVLSHRAILERERAAEREKLLETLEVGQIREGVVRNIREFGAFVDLGGVDGMIHISQLSWERVKHPRDVVSEGETVRVKIEKIDPKNKKIGLSLRSLQEHPWTGAAEKFPVGSVPSGTVTRIANFGAFVKLATGVEGLVHVSELAHHRVSLVSSVVKEGETVNVKVLSVDPENQRISLSIKQTIEQPESEKKSGKKDEPEEVREPTLPQHKGPLKGGVDTPSGGEKFGLKW